MLSPPRQPTPLSIARWQPAAPLRWILAADVRWRGINVPSNCSTLKSEPKLGFSCLMTADHASDTGQGHVLLCFPCSVSLRWGHNWTNSLPYRQFISPFWVNFDMSCGTWPSHSTDLPCRADAYNYWSSYRTGSHIFDLRHPFPSPPLSLYTRAYATVPMFTLSSVQNIWNRDFILIIAEGAGRVTVLGWIWWKYAAWLHDF